MFLIDMFNKKTTMPEPQHALKGREAAFPTSSHHFVNGRPLQGPFDGAMQRVVFAMGCFWAAERLFWTMDGVSVTAAGYQGGYTLNPTHQEVTTGLTGHAEAVLVVFDPQVVTLETLLARFFEGHDPTQGMRQGQDIGTAYRSAVFASTSEQQAIAEAVRERYRQQLQQAGRSSSVTTEITLGGPFYYADAAHQQYLARNPGASCGLRGTGVACVL